ncbi:MAG TPA: adenylyl-sulfate kinase [Gaiellaceae bacterium]
MTGFTLWFTGLSGSGKTTIADRVAPELTRRGRMVEKLDGDVVRTHLSTGLGFSKEDRDTNVERIGWVASRLTRAGVAVIVSAISPYAEARHTARAYVEEFGPFIEIHVATPIEECERRDVKGLYAKARAGEIPEFTGVSDPYEEPANPELRLDTTQLKPEESVRLILAKLEGLGCLGVPA